MKFPKFLLIFLIALYSASSLGQNKILDSLLVQLDKASGDTEKIGLYNMISAEYTANDPAKMMKYAKLAQDLAQKKRLKKGEADSWFNMGNGHIMQSNYAESFKSFTNAQSLYEQLLKETENNKLLDIQTCLGQTYGSLGVVFSEQNSYAKSLEYYFKALKLYSQIKQEDIVAVLYNNIGIVYKSQKDYNKALEYYNKALTIQKKLKDHDAGVTITNIGTVYMLQGKDDKALASFNEAARMFQINENKRGLGELYNSFGNYYVKKKDYTAAKGNYTKAIAIFDAMEEKYGTSASLGYLGNLYSLQKKDKEALDNLQRSSALAGEIGVLSQVRDSEKSISEIYEKTGNYAAALKHYKIYSRANDSLNNAENIKSIVRAEMNYEMEQRAALQKSENEKREAIYNEKAKRQKQQIIFAGLSMLLLFGIAFLIYNRRHLKKTLTLQRDLAEYEQKALHLQMNPHFVFNCLGSISSFIVQNGTDSAIKYLSKFSKLMRLTLEYSKESLIPIDKEIEGLQNYLELEQLRFNNVFDFSITKDANIEDDMAIPPLLLQPFVENSIIHGVIPKKEQGSININFAIVDEKLVCTVTDNGIGFSKSKEMKENSVTVHKSMALEITRKRLEVIQAYTSKTSRVEINDVEDDAGKSAGTRIILNLPIQYATI
jgi:tetratricopeptide (TPR) repeat protein